MSLRQTFERWEAGLADWAARGTLLRVALLVGLVSVAMSLPGLMSIPPIDRDEARFAQATKQMMETGNYIDIRLQDEARHKKPVGIYWLQAAAAKVSGRGAEAPIWVYRIPSVIGIAISAMLSTVVAAVFLGRSRALLVGLLVAAAILPNVEARLAKTDAVLLATIVAFHVLIACAWVGRRTSSTPPRGLWIASWLALGLGVLVKGPIAPMVAGLATVSLCTVSRDWRWPRHMRPLPGLALVLLVCLPWYLAIGIQTDWAFYSASAGDDLLGKAASGQESHGAPPGVHLLASLGTFWPLSAFAVLAFAKVRSQLSHPAVLFSLCWALPTWIVFELVPTKLPHYILPILPAIALLTMTLLQGTDRDRPRWLGRLAEGLFVLVPVVLAAALLGAGFYLASLRVLTGALVLTFAAFLAIRLRPVPQQTSVLASCAVAFLVYLGTFPLGMAGLKPLWISSALANAVESVAPCERPTVLLAGFREPSAVFLLGTGTQLMRGAEAAVAFRDAACAVVIVERRQSDAFRDVLHMAYPIRRVEGINLNGGDELAFDIYATAP